MKIKCGIFQGDSLSFLLFSLALAPLSCELNKLDQEETYKYLGIEKGDGIQHGKMKEKIRNNVTDE